MIRPRYFAALAIAVSIFLGGYLIGRATMFSDVVSLIGEMLRNSR